ncbi:RNA polymerase sigma-70 factor [Chitinophaga sp. MM2321]|uniref:RNA polymerase sigma-70 factor n=1 Tax=Chitinophaga sp. MM2321 TaxID=3137178 RepID=UPI0032D5AFE1
MSSTNSRLTETELIEQLQRDSVPAFDALYNMYFQAVYANILRITRETAASEDIVQEVFIRLWEKRSTVKSGQSVGNWLFVVSYNRSMNYLRARLREKLGIQELTAVVTAEGTDDWLMTEMQLHALEEAIDSLPPQRKKVFLLCKMQGKSYAEAAEDLQISKYTVKEHIVKANDFIREYVRLHPKEALGLGMPLIACLLY